MNDGSSNVQRKAGVISATVRATSAFHRLDRMIPDDQVVEAIPSGTKAFEAIKTMAESGFSQVPVVNDGTVIGLFSYRSFAQAVLETSVKGRAPDELGADECVERVEFALLADDLEDWIDNIEELEAILVGFPRRVHAILTSSDMLRHLYAFARPFVLIAEIEICLRCLIVNSVNNESMRDCCDKALSNYRESKRPYSVDEMTFGDYVSLISHEENWERFRAALGGQRERAKTKLKEAKALRNAIFHFSRPIDDDDCNQLSGIRSWLLQRAIQLDASNEGDAQ